MDKEFACCVDLGSTAPPLAQLLPAGPSINGLDGQRWTFDEEALEAVLAAFERRNRPLVVEPAAGRIVGLEARERGELWGRVEWTPRGADQVARRQYRFISVSFQTEPHLRRIQELTGAKLTNDPNYNVLALNRAEHNMQATHLAEPELAICRALDIHPGDFANTQVAQNRARTGTNTSGLTETELAVCRSLGISPEQYITGKENFNG